MDFPGELGLFLIKHPQNLSTAGKKLVDNEESKVNGIHKN